MINENNCTACALIKKTLPPFTKEIYSDGITTRVNYKLSIPDWSHNETYLKLGLYDNIINIKYCFLCGRPINSLKKNNNNDEDAYDEDEFDDIEE